MAKKDTVLILGAGASKPYGLPLGSELRHAILGMHAGVLDKVFTEPGTALVTPGQGQRFQAAFRGSQEYSIDAFLGKRSEFSEVGKHAIVRALLPMEDASRLLESDPDDHWYRYLVNVMPNRWDELKDCAISFVTFNYDRSLELFLVKTWVHRFGVTEYEAFQMLKHFEIVHVYGSLGSIEPNTPNYVPYGGENQVDWYLHSASKSLRVIPEDRVETNAEFERAKALIDRADILCILGFGYDPTNVERLGGKSIIKGFAHKPGGVVAQTPSHFAATSRGLTDAQRQKAASRISLDENQAFTVAMNGLLGMTSLQLLHETLILER